MEDISRELEREIARAKPSPHKASNKKRILIIDDFGELRSGGYLKVLVYFFSLIGFIGVSGTIGFYYFFAEVQKKNLKLEERLTFLEKKANRLTTDKELLMARLVLSGKKPDLVAPTKVDPENSVAQIPSVNEKEITKPEKEENVKPAIAKEKNIVATPKSDLPQEPGSFSGGSGKSESRVLHPVVSVENFSITRGKNDGKLIVNFNIRNISKDSKEISGRIFAVLKPDEAQEKDWLMIPNGRMENGLPGPHGKGQYFSITRFKPVVFSIKSQVSPESFSGATVFIFGDDGKLLFDNTIQINGA